MNRFDMEFWNGFLKGVLAAEHQLIDMVEKSAESSGEGLNVAINILKELKDRTEKLHSEDVRAFLRQYE